jgi:short subunit dehydrogenase-like uncharacterized protein
MKIVVVGGHGYLGSMAVAALRRDPSVTALAAGRSARGDGSVRVDLTDPTTFAAVDVADVVVDVADATTTAPDALAAYCQRRGITFLEATSDRDVVTRLMARTERAGDGAVVLGAGIFTGLSNLLARAAAAKVTGARSVTWAVRSTPFSGAGTGTVKLMAALLAMPTVRYEGGRRVEGPPVRTGPRMPFPSGEAPSIEVPFAEAEMIHRSLGVDVTVAMSPYPNVLQAVFLWTPAWMLRSGWYRWFMAAYFTVLRRVFLAKRASPVEMVARAEGEAGATATMTLHADNGMRAGAVAIAAIARVLGARRPAQKGAVMVDEVMGIAEVLAAMDGLSEGRREVVVG